MKVLVIGGGGREHALSWRLKKDPLVSAVFAAPGNPGIAADGITCIELKTHEATISFCRSEKIDLVVIGPEIPLCAGLGDDLRAAGFPVFGPGAKGAQLEGSKAFAKDFMVRHGIPTAASGTFDDEASALAFIATNGAPIVVKADGLAAGKGVTVAMTEAEAVAAVKDCFAGAFGAAGHRVLIEEFLDGEEASLFALCDGETILHLATAQDHKRVGDGDTGPNTGGMGTYSPAPVCDAAVDAICEREVLSRFLAGLKADGLEFRGVIFIGLMIGSKGVRLLEFNVRFGDPETQSLMMRWESGMADALLKTATGQLKDAKPVFSDEPAVCVVLASGGYPGDYAKGFPISGLDAAAATGAKVFHAGTALKDGQVVNTGGRVLGVTASAATVRQALDIAYRGVDQISWQGAFCRRDIAWRSLAREK